MLNNKEDLGDSVGVEDEKKVHTTHRTEVHTFSELPKPNAHFLKSFFCV